MRRFAVILLLCSCASPPPEQPAELLGAPPADADEPRIVFEVLDEPEEAHATPTPTATSPGSPLGKRRITLDVRDVDVREVLRLLAEEANANIVVDDAVRGRVTLTLRNVSLDDAFYAVLRSQGLAYEQRGRIVLVDGR